MAYAPIPRMALTLPGLQKYETANTLARVLVRACAECVCAYEWLNLRIEDGLGEIIARRAAKTPLEKERYGTEMEKNYTRITTIVRIIWRFIEWNYILRK